MKKIVALVLCLVLALSLCTVAMAGTAKYDAYTIATNAENGRDLTYAAAEDLTVANYSEATGAYIFVPCAQADATDYLVPAGTAADKLATTAKIYVKQAANATAEYKAAKYTNVGATCDMIDADEYDSDDLFYSVYDKTTKTYTYYVAKTFNSVGATRLLVGDTLVFAAEVTADKFIAHTWAIGTKDAKDNILTVKCSKCGNVGTVYGYADTIPTDVELGNAFGVTFYYTKGAGSTTATVESAKTFDAGIALYAGMALASVAGSAVVIGKKKEF